MKEDCKNIQIRLTDFADKKLDENTTAAVRMHLQKCEPCSRELEEISELFVLMEKVPEQDPPAELRSDFLKMLDKEKENLNREKEDMAPKQGRKSLQVLSMPFTRMAAAILLLLAGFGLGYLMRENPETSEFARLQTKMNRLEKEMMLMKLKEESPSQRIYAANYLEQKSAADPEIVKALKNAATEDENSNVRQAALLALYNTTADQERDFFIGLLNNEENPLVQITLIEILVNMNDKQAIEPLENILYDDKSMDAVKLQARRGLETFV